MRFVFVVAAVVATTLATPTPVEYQHTGKDALSSFFEKQKIVLGLFRYINQPSHYKTHIEIADSYDPEHNIDGYEKPEFVEEFFHYYHNGILERDEIFSVFNDVHLKQAIALFNVFYHAKDFDTFYKTAVWARQHVNQGMFLYTFSVAIIHRPDTFGIVLPPIYEVYPHYFFNDEVINKVQIYKQKYHQEHKTAGEHPYLIYANCSGHYLNLHPEQSMSYYLEDVGINAFYYYYNIFVPFWMTSKHNIFGSDLRGELYYYVHQQLLARYHLERISEKLGEISFFNWEVPFETGYYPSLHYPNGLEFPERPNYAVFQKQYKNYGQRWGFKQHPYGYSYLAVDTIEERLVNAIQLGYVLDIHGGKVPLYTEEGLNILGNMIEGNADSVHFRYYGGYCDKHNQYHGGYVHYARHLLGYARQPQCYHQTQPSALEHYETSLRDPAFYQFYKKVVLLVQMYKSYLDPYTAEDLHFDGVKITNVEMDRLVTYFDHFDSDITNAVYVSEEEFDDHEFAIYVRQERLTHRPYTYKMHVYSDKDVEATVKVYIGPKHDEYGREIHLNENRLNYVQLEEFKYDLKTGDNVIERNSYAPDNYWYRGDPATYKQLYKNVLNAEDGTEKFYVTGNQGEKFLGFPLRYMLPKGSFDGVEYDFVFVVSPYEHGKELPLGYPFDRFIVPEAYHDATNIYSHSAKVFHRKAEDINASTVQH